MAKLNVKVEDGTTVVTVDNIPITGLTHIRIYCEGNNRDDDVIELSYQGLVQGTNIDKIVSNEGEIDITIPDALGELLKG